MGRTFVLFPLMMVSTIQDAWERLKPIAAADGREEVKDLVVVVGGLVSHALSPAGSLQGFGYASGRMSEDFRQALTRYQVKFPSPGGRNAALTRDQVVDAVNRQSAGL